MKRRMRSAFGTGWRIIAIIIGVFLLGMCACVGLGFVLQALGQVDHLRGLDDQPLNEMTTARRNGW
jgi:hypothetical protein